MKRLIAALTTAVVAACSSPAIAANWYYQGETNEGEKLFLKGQSVLPLVEPESQITFYTFEYQVGDRRRFAGIPSQVCSLKGKDRYFFVKLNNATAKIPVTSQATSKMFNEVCQSGYYY